jgi:hypothetical protein
MIIGSIIMEENMKKITHALELYKSQTKELEECIVPSTPSEVRAQQDQDAT